MNIEHQVASLELSKRLKELGVKQESYVWWADTEADRSMWNLITHNDRLLMERHEEVAAFTVAELGEMLPISVCDPPGADELDPGMEEKKTYYLFFRIGNEWNKPLVQLGDVHEGVRTKWYYEAIADTEADARAKMLIHLIEKGIVKP